MLVEAIVCVSCGGPLPAVSGLPALVECAFCGATISVTHGESIVTRKPVVDASHLQRLSDARVQFHAQLAAALAAGRQPYDALREASAAHLGSGGQTAALARVAIAIAHDFKRQTRANIADAFILARIAEGYLRAVEDLRERPETELNLPFLAVTEQGPLHLSRTLTPRILAELGARDPSGDPAPVAAGGAPEASAAPEAKKKRGWWPF